MLVSTRKHTLRSIGRAVLTSAAVLVLLIGTGCESDSTGPSDEDQQEAQALADEGFTLLISALDAETPDPTILNQAKGKFEDALDLDPENGDANVGLALTEIALMGTNAEILALIGEFGPLLGLEAASSPSLGKLVGGQAVSADPVFSAEKTLDWFRHGFARPGQVTPPPDLGQIQDLAEAVVLPVMELVMDLLAVVEGLDEWHLTLTAAMTGMEEGALEIDQTDIYMVDAVVHAMAAEIYAMVAYDMDTPTVMSDTLAVKAAFDQDTGTFMTLRTNGAANLGNSRTALLDGIARMNSFIAGLQTETDDQSDDMIKLDPTGNEGPTQEDLDEMLTGLAAVYAALTSPQTITEDFDDDGMDEDLQVDLSVLFTDPITDLKALLPPYTWDSTNEMYFWDGYLSEDFSAFVFPDPDFNGVLPQFTTDAEFKAFFDITNFGSPGPFTSGTPSLF